MNQKAIRVQYLNPDPWVRLIGDTNETKVVLEGVNCTSLIDSGRTSIFHYRTTSSHPGIRD